MGITTVKLVRNLKKNSFNWFKPVCAQFSDITITDSQKDMVI